MSPPENASEELVEAPSSAPDGEHPGDLLRASIQRFVRTFGLLDGDQTPCGVPLAPTHAHALAALLDRDRRETASTQQDLVKVLGIDKSNVARLCARMIEAGHLIHTESLEDGRVWRLSLTPKGRRLAERVEGASRSRFDHIVAALPSAAARSAVIRSLDLLNEAISATRKLEESR
jgi:DNA-binding MarR family transcriptional regulator